MITDIGCMTIITKVASSANSSVLENLDSYTPAELKRMLVDVLLRQRLGLYWEKDLIAHDRALNECHVFVKLVDEENGKSLSCGEAPYKNLIIEGENFGSSFFCVHISETKIFVHTMRRRALCGAEGRIRHDRTWTA
jgi:hypothetical protein